MDENTVGERERCLAVGWPHEPSDARANSARGNALPCQFPDTRLITDTSNWRLDGQVSMIGAGPVLTFDSSPAIDKSATGLGNARAAAGERHGRGHLQVHRRVARRSGLGHSQSRAPVTTKESKLPAAGT